MSATKHSKRKRSREVLQDLEDELRRTRAELDQLRRAGSGQQQLRDELGLLQRVVHQSTTARQTLALVNVYREEVGAKCKRLRRDLLLCCHPDHHHRYETAEQACPATTQAIERVFERVFEEFPSQ